jgi:hypothetical protein
MEQEGKQIVGVTDSSVQKTSHMKLDILENIYEMLRDIWIVAGMGESTLGTGQFPQENIKEFQN